MKNNLFILPVFICLSILSKAQLNKSVPVSADSLKKELPGRLFTQFVQSVNSTSYKSSFEKDKILLLKNINKVNDPLEMAKKVTALAIDIKPAMLKTDFSMQEFSKRAAGAKTMIYAMNMLSDLEQGLKPEAISGVWKFQKNNWLAEMTKVE